MKKDISVQPALFPMPVLLIASYDSQENADGMNRTWSSSYEEDAVILNLSSHHKTTQKIKEKNTFTMGFATVPLLKERFNEKRKIDSNPFQGVIFDGFNNRYLALGEEVGKAWDLGKEILKEYE